ncbi:MAG: putative ABC transport system permease protein [Bacteroidetes bacterium]|nr:MAG: putative ABC transport system permease protein [Bacteroidota bacterium]
MLFLTLFRESILFALTALRVNRLRTFLSLLGVTIGIFAIIAVFTFVDSIEQKVKGSVQSLGDDVVFIQKWPWTFGPDYPWWKYLNRPVPQVDELEDVQRRSQSAQAICFAAETRKSVFFQSSVVENVGIKAVSFEYEQVKNFELEDGRYFTEIEAQSGKPVCVMGYAVANALFRGKPATGQSVKIFGRKIQIIGVFKKEGESMFGNSLDAFVVMPVLFARNVMDVNSENLDPYMMAKCKPGVTKAELIDELTGVMRSVRKLKPDAEPNFALNEVSVLSEQTESMFGVVGIAGLIIGVFSLLVGGFGIANIMFVSVRERTGQIGIQKSLGAKSWFILMQFLSEAVMLCIIGGLFGLLIVWGLSIWINSAFEQDMHLTLANIVLAMTVSTLIGVIAGFIPSYSASQLDPVEAIRTNI